jgi:microcystin-dependent protein
MIARHTPTLENKSVTRLVTVDVALLGHVGDALAILTEETQWKEVGDPVSDVLAELWLTLSSYYQDSMIGKIDQFISVPPPAWLEFDGETYSQTDYPELTAIIPAAWKNGGNFTVPDLADYFCGFVGSTGTPGTVGGTNELTLTVGQLPAHDHTYTPPVLDVDFKSVGAPNLIAASMGTPTTTGQTGDGDPVDNRPQYISFILAIFSGRAL